MYLLGSNLKNELYEKMHKLMNETNQCNETLRLSRKRTKIQITCFVPNTFQLRRKTNMDNKRMSYIPFTLTACYALKERLPCT